MVLNWSSEIDQFDLAPHCLENFAGCRGRMAGAQIGTGANMPFPAKISDDAHALLQINTLIVIGIKNALTLA
ncbi:hypothetical protein D3C84_1211030 [compost metagenome]